MCDSAKISFEDFYEENFMKLQNYLARKIGSREDAEDLCQEVFAYCYKNYDTYDPQKSSYTTWLYMVATSRLKNYYRDRKNFVDVELVENLVAEDNISQVEQAEYLQSVRQEIAKALLLLPVNQREVVVKKYFLGKSHEEIAEELGISPVNSRVLLTRGLNKLSKILESEKLLEV